MNFIPTPEKVTVENYPYGYTLRTTLFDTIEFDKRKGYRHVTQTVNPKNNQLNKPKKSTYSPLMVRYYNADNHIKVLSFDLNGGIELNKASEFLSVNLNLFTNEEIQYLCLHYITMFKLDTKANVIYCNAKFEDLKPLYEKQLKILVDGANNPTQMDFSKVLLDVEAIKNCGEKDFNPFSVKKYN